MKNYTHKSKYFYGNQISEYGLKNGYVDYRTLAKCGDMVLCNDIPKLFYTEIGCDYIEPNQVNGYIDNQQEIYQYYIISDNLAEILKDLTDEIVYYIDYLDIYVWGITHYGTSWDYVLTNIKIELGDDE